MKKDPFPLLFLDSVLDSVVGHKMYSFISQYDQVKMAEDEENTWFISKWGAYAYFNAMPLLYAMLFSLDDAPLHSKVVTRWDFWDVLGWKYSSISWWFHRLWTKERSSQATIKMFVKTSYHWNWSEPWEMCFLCQFWCT